MHENDNRAHDIAVLDDAVSDPDSSRSHHIGKHGVCKKSITNYGDLRRRSDFEVDLSLEVLLDFCSTTRFLYRWSD